MKRQSKHEFFFDLMDKASEQGTCTRRKVGGVLVKDGIPISIAYNGVLPNHIHCIEDKCPGADLPSGQGLDKCEAVHAEQNLIGNCSKRGISTQDTTVYLPCSPCVSCVKLLITAGIINIIYKTNYPHDTTFKLLKKSNYQFEDFGYYKIWYKLKG